MFSDYRAARRAETVSTPTACAPEKLLTPHSSMSVPPPLRSEEAPGAPGVPAGAPDTNFTPRPGG